MPTKFPKSFDEVKCSLPKTSFVIGSINVASLPREKSMHKYVFNHIILEINKILPCNRMISKNISYIDQSSLPSNFHFICSAMACLFKDLPIISGLFPHIGWIQTVENRNHHLTTLFLAYHDLQQFVQTPA